MRHSRRPPYLQFIDAFAGILLSTNRIVADWWPLLVAGVAVALLS
jgi:hypothetical protein